ncbi:MAG: hypothetical protein HC850_16405 [Rhodomicrobium sp.]|nr:hypothetical protein [Rhodomicrobium sp.]
MGALDSFNARQAFLSLAILGGFAGLGFVLSAALAWRFSLRVERRQPPPANNAQAVGENSG